MVCTWRSSLPILLFLAFALPSEGFPDFENREQRRSQTAGRADRLPDNRVLQRGPRPPRCFLTSRGAELYIHTCLHYFRFAARWRLFHLNLNKQKTEVSSWSSAHRRPSGDAQEDWGLRLLCLHGGGLFGAHALQLLKRTKWTWTPTLF